MNVSEVELASPTAPAIARLVVAGDGTVSVVTVPLCKRSEVTVALLVASYSHTYYCEHE